MKVQTRIQQLVNQALAPSHLELVNESHMHSVPPNSETHFKLTVVSNAFAGQRQVQRHQQVYGVLKEVMQNPVHALALHTFTPDEWSVAIGVPASPLCMGGQKAG